MRMRDLRLGRAMALLCGISGHLLTAAVFAVPLTLLAHASPAPAAPSRVVAEAPASLPSARSIIDRHIAAVGGRKAIMARTSTRMTGTVTMSGNGLTGNLEVLAAKPDRTLSRITLAAIGEILEGYNGAVAWSVSPMTGPMLAQGKELAQKKFDADFYGELRDGARYASITTVEKTTFEGRPGYKVSLLRKDGGEDFEFYDVETGLKTGAIASRETHMGVIATTVWQGDYKTFGGILQPTTFRQTSLGVQIVMSINAIEYDNVAPSAFEPPAAIKALIK
jgi:hypothetical protein